MDELEKRAIEVENDVEQSLVDRRGLVRSAVDINTMQPFSPGYFEGKSVYCYPGHCWNDFADYMTYENVGMCSGAFIAAMIWKYRITKNPAALEKAHRTFRGVQWLFDVSQSFAEGFFCKCYGGKPGEQISSDQYLYALAGLDQFMHFADHASRAQCAAMMEKMVGFWMRRSYSYPYFGRPLAWPLERFPVFAWLAWHHTGKPEFRLEFERLCLTEAVKSKIPFGTLTWGEKLQAAQARAPAFEFEKKAPVRLVRFNPENTSSGFLSLEAMLEYNAPGRALWLEKAWKMYDRDRRWIGDDGHAFGAGLYNTETGAVTEVKEVLNVPAAHPDKWRYGGFVGWIRSGMHSAMFARAAVALDRYFPGCGAFDQAMTILTKLDRNKLRWFVDMDGKQFPADLKWMHNVYSGDAATNWLWAYWQARAKY